MKQRLVLCLVVLPAACGQVLMDGAGGPVRLQPTDAAILEGQELRTDLTCRVKAVKPELGFDLGLHTGYEVSVPFEDLAGDGNQLTAVFRVTPEDNQDQPIYFSQRWKVPPLAQDAKGTATLRGEFVLGAGKYQVAWLMRDRDERYCTARWQISADARGKDKLVELRMARGTAAPEPAEPFVSEKPVKRDTERAFHVVVLLHLESQASRPAGIEAKEMEAVLSIMRNIAREPRIASYSITAFNLERQQIVFRTENAPQVDFPALGEAIKRLQLGTIDARALRQNDSETQFLSGLLTERTNRADALIFVGPKTSAEFKLHGKLSDLAEPQCPVFYLNYDADPVSNPWHDLIGSVVKVWKGFEYSISRPRDLSMAWNDVMARISSKDLMRDSSKRAGATTALTPKK